MSSQSKKKPAMEKDADSRRTPRRIYRRQIGLLSQGKYHVIQALELSEGGLVFQSSDEFNVKDQVVTSLIVPGGGVIVARGEVQQVKTDAKQAKQVYIKFKSLTLQLRRFIRNYVTAKTQAEAEKEDKSGNEAA